MHKQNTMERDGSMNKFVKFICPRAEELSVIVNNVRCEECGLTFSNEPRLRMHVLKIHEHKNLKKNVKEDVRYHCPEITCVYALKSQRYFTTMKYLKQHYLKVHAAKTFACTQCDKSFSTEATRLAHLRICGVQFICSCLRIFGTYEALLTHGKRLAHKIDEKYKKTLVRNSRGKTPRDPELIRARSQQGGSKPVSILPHQTNCSFPTTSMKIAFDVAVQTDEVKRQKRTPSPSKAWKRRESRQTQTTGISTRDKRARKTVETQTTQKSRNPAGVARRGGIKDEKSSFVKDLQLHENFSSDDNLFAASPLELEHDDVALRDFWEEKTTSLGTQTSPGKDFLEVLSDSVTQTDLVRFYDRDEPPGCLNIGSKVSDVSSLTELAYVEDSSVPGSYSFNPSNRISRSDPMLTIDSFTDRFSSIETQTDVANSTRETFFDTVSLVGRNFTLGSNNTETQTTENFDNIEQLLYSNTCTQTCNDILPTDLGLSDIQTQTAWPELEDATISTETQTGATNCPENVVTISSSCCRSWLNTRISHTETQTDLLSLFDEFQ